MKKSCVSYRNLHGSGSHQWTKKHATACLPPPNTLPTPTAVGVGRVLGRSWVGDDRENILEDSGLQWKLSRGIFLPETAVGKNRHGRYRERQKIIRRNSNYVPIADNQPINVYESDYKNQRPTACPRRHNAKGWKPIFIPLDKARKRVETVFSQLCDQYMVIRNYATHTGGLLACIIGKISAMSVA